MAAIKIIKTKRVRIDDEANMTWVMMRVDRKISKKVIIPRKRSDEVMRDEGGGGYAAEMGRGYDSLEGG